MTEKNNIPRLVHWSYYSGTGIFASKNTREELTQVTIIDPKGEPLLESGRIAALTSGVRREDPYFQFTRTQGFTSRARKHMDMKFKMQKSNPDEEDTLTSIKDMVLPYGDYVFINLPFLDNYVNPIIKDKEFKSEHFVYKDSFTKEFIGKLLDYKPQAMMGGTIWSYEKEKLPELLTSIRKNFPELYQELLDSNQKVKDFEEQYTSVGKHALLSTLLPGAVKVRFGFLDTFTFNWDGHVLTRDHTLYDESKVILSIEPSEETTAEILSDDTVTEQTVLVEKKL